MDKQELAKRKSKKDIRDGVCSARPVAHRKPSGKGISRCMLGTVENLKELENSMKLFKDK